MTKIPFCRPFVNEQDGAEVAKTVSNGWITTGKVTSEVEARIANYLGAKNVILLDSCTSALFLSFEYLKRFKIKKDTFNAIVPSLTFAATATEVLNSGGSITFGDVNKDTMCLEPINGIYDIAVPVHLCGVKADTNYGCPVVEDSAHLFYRNQMVDNKNLVCFSFYATKNVTMGEGGAIATNDDQAAAWFKQARHHGISKGGWDRYAKMNSWEYDIEFIGWKCNPSDIMATLLNQSLDKVDIIEQERTRCVNLYNELLGYNNAGLHLYPVLVSDRSKFIEIMAENGVQCSVHFLPLHKMTAFKTLNASIYPETALIHENSLENTEDLGSKLVSLPLFPGLTNDEIILICQIANSTGLLLKK